MTWSIGIPSWRRPELVTSRSLRTLADAGVPRERVFLFVAAEELPAYRACIDVGLVNDIVPHDSPGILSGAHNAIVDTLGPGQVVHMDDDISGFSRALDTKTLEPITNLSEVIDHGFELCARTGATLWGIYPVRNPYFMKPKVTTKATFVIGHLFGQIISGRRGERNTLNIKDDYERSLNHFMMDGCVVRMDWVVADTKVYTSPGGLSTYRTPERVEAEVVDLERRFPGLVHRTKVRNGLQEIVIRERARR